MARLKLPLGGARKALALSEWLYAFFLHAYPAPFRHTYGSRMARVFRDSCRAAVERHGIAFLIPFWLHTLSDLVGSACLERWYLFKKEICSKELKISLFPFVQMALEREVCLSQRDLKLFC